MSEESRQGEDRRMGKSEESRQGEERRIEDGEERRIEARGANFENIYEQD